MANNGNGNSTIKQSLEADLVMKDSGTIDAMLNKVKALHAEIQGLQKSMDTAMGSRSAESGLAKQLQELTASMRTMKQQMESLGHASATSGQGGKLLFGATAAGQLQGLKDLRTAEEKLYQQRILNGKYSAKALLQETDARKLALAQEALQLKLHGEYSKEVKKTAAEHLAALQKELQLRKERDSFEVTSRKATQKSEAARRKEINTAHGEALRMEKELQAGRDAEAKKRADFQAQAQAVANGTLLGLPEQRKKRQASVAADNVTFGPGQDAVGRAVKAAQNRVAKFNLTEQLKVEAIANRNPALLGLQHEQLLAQAKMSNIRLALAGNKAEQEAEYKTKLEIQEHIKALKKIPPTLDQIQAAQVKLGRMKMSQQSMESIGGRLSSLTDHDLRSLAQGQKTRDLAGQGMNSPVGVQQSRDAQAVLDAIKKEQDARKEAANKKIADDKRIAANKQKLIEDGAKVELDADAKKRRNATGIVDEIKATRDLADEKRKYSVAEAARIADIAKNNKVTVDGIKEIKHLHDINDQLAASRHRFRATSSQAEKQAEVDLQQLLRLRAQELNKLHRQDKTVESDADRAARLDMARRNTRERLFGDGGANTMIVQAGLMANYQVLGGLQSLLSGAASSAIEFDKALKQVQAVSAATRNEMVDLRQSLIEVAQSSRFSAAEVAQASVLLAQAGLSVKEIQQTMAATIALATASGSELKKSVDVMTSVLSVFDMGADKSTDVANKLTAALNMSKLDIDKMALGLQYAGNAAADAGVTFDELVSTLSAMANAGIRSGSTLGTGTRQLFVELQKPSENFKKVLDRLGVGMSQIDIKAQGFEGVLRNLQEAGFTTGDAFQSFQIRAASSFAALSNNINVFHDMQDAIEGTNAAMEANEIQMESLAVQYDHLKSNLGIVAAEGFAPILAAVRDTVKMFAHFFEGAEKGSASLKVAFTALAGAALAVTAAVSLNMLVGLVKLGGGMKGLFTVTSLTTVATDKFTVATGKKALADELAASAAMHLARAEGYAAVGALEHAAMARASAAAATAQAVAMNASAAAATRAGWAMRFFSAAPIVLGLGLIATAFISFGKESDKLKDKLDEARTTLNGFVEANSKSQQTIENVDEAVNTLATRYGRLSENSQELDGFVKELANQFKDQGLTIENLAGQSIEQLIETLGRLRTELSNDYIINIREEGKAKVDALKLEAERKKLQAQEEARALPSYLSINAGQRTEPQRLNEAVKSYALYQGDPEMQRSQLANYGGDVGQVRAGLNKQLKRTNLLPWEREFFDRLVNILTLTQTSMATGGQVAATQKNSTVAQQRERFIEEARANPNSGYSLATQLTADLSKENFNNKKEGAGLDYLRGNLALVDTKIKQLQDAQEVLRKATDPAQMAKAQALANEETELAKLKSTYEQQMAPLVLERNKLKKDLAKYELEDAEAEVKRLEDLISNENNAGKVRGELADSLAAAQRNVGKKKVDLLVATMDAEKASDARKAAAVAREQAAIQRQLDKTTTVISERSEAIIKAEESFQQDRGQDALKKPFTDLGKRLDDFDTNLKGLLDDRASSVSAKVRQLKQRIQDNRLAGAGIATSGDLYGPKALGRNNDLADLSFRRRAGAQFRSAALGKELQKAQVEEAKLKVSAIDQELPKLLAIQDDHKKELDRLAASRDEARQGYIAKDTEYDRRVKAGEAIPDNFMAERKLAYETYKEANALYDSEEKQANNIKDKIYGLEDTKGNLLDVLGNQEGKFQMWLDALKTGVEGLTQSFSDMFQRIVTGTGDTEEAFREMGRGILASMLKVITDKIAQKFMEIAGKFIGDALMPSPAAAAGSTGMAGLNFDLSAPSMTSTFAGSRNGGPIHRRAGGGYVPGSVARDAVPTLLMPGEFVLQKSASAALGEDFLHGLNRTTGATMRQGAERAAKAAAPTAKGEPSSVNVWVVTPDQQTGMSKDDIIVTVGDNIARNGSIRKLIKQVQVGG